MKSAKLKKYEAAYAKCLEHCMKLKSKKAQRACVKSVLKKSKSHRRRSSKRRSRRRSRSRKSDGGCGASEVVKMNWMEDVREDVLSLSPSQNLAESQRNPAVDVVLENLSLLMVEDVLDPNLLMEDVDVNLALSLVLVNLIVDLIVDLSHTRSHVDLSHLRSPVNLASPSLTNLSRNITLNSLI